MTADFSPFDLLDHLVSTARAHGAEQIDAALIQGSSLSVARRHGALERLERSESLDIGLRVMVGRRQAGVSSSDMTPQALNEMAERVVSMAKAAPEDPHCGLAAPDQLAESISDLDVVGDDEPPQDLLIERASVAEQTALAVTGITNSEGAEASWSQNRVTLVASNGFAQDYTTSAQSLSVAVLAGSGTAMERDYDYAVAVHGEDLADPATLGQRAGERAVARLNPHRVTSARMPVVFDPRVANSLVGHLAAACNGAAVARRTSFLRDSLGQTVFAPGVTIVDDPHRRRGLRSKPFDGEGLPNLPLRLVENGVLGCWLLDLASSRQLGLASNGRASRGLASPPSPAATNLYLEAGDLTPNDLIADIAQGVYITEMLGSGVNMVTGDYSRGAVGFRIENGQLGGPISEFTIAGNLRHMFRQLTPANDLEFRYGTNAPTLRIDDMTVAGG